MSEEHMEIEPGPPRPEARRGGGRMMAAGVVGACVLGASLGLWARPAAEDRGLEPETPEAAAAPSPEPTRILQIVVDDTPAPVGQPLDVLPADIPPEGHARALEIDTLPAAPKPVEPVAPKRPPEGLMKVADAIAPAPVVVPPAPKPRTETVARAEPKPKPKAEPARPKAEKAVARDEKPAAKREKAKVAKAEAPKSKKADLETVRLAKAEKPKAEKKARTPEPKKDVRMAALVRAVKKAPAKLKDEVRLAERKAAQAKKDREVRLAEAREAKARTEKARREKAARVQLAKAAPKPKPKAVRAEPQVQRVRNTCVSADPGEALVCGDPRLSVRERQMQRAYRDAEAAGVPASELRRQQDRWRAARAAAARDGSWAVEEVYEARIAELNDQSRRDSSY